MMEPEAPRNARLNLWQSLAGQVNISNWLKHKASGMQVSELDVSSFASIRQFSRRWADSGRRIDCLINNAGIFSINGMSLPRRRLSLLVKALNNVVSSGGE